MKKEQWDFYSACMSGNLKEVMELIQKKGRVDVHQSQDQGFRTACACGKLEVVKYLTSNHEFIKKYGSVDIHAQNEDALVMACHMGHLNIIEYLMTSKELVEAGHTWPKLEKIGKEAFYGACMNGQNKILEYWINNKELREAGHQNIKDIKIWEGGLGAACVKGHLSTAKYLMSIAHENESGKKGFSMKAKRSAFKKSLMCNHEELVKWWIMNHHVPWDEETKSQILKSNMGWVEELLRAMKEKEELDGLFKNEETCRENEMKEASNSSGRVKLKKL